MDEGEDATLPSSFVEHIKEFLSMSNEEIQAVFDGLERRHTLFSTKYFAEIVKKEVHEVQLVRSNFLFLLHYIQSHYTKEEMASRLVSAGCDKDRVKFVMDKVSALSKKALLSGNFLYDVRTFIGSGKHLRTLEPPDCISPILSRNLARMVRFLCSR